MKDQIMELIGSGRWTRLERQAVEQGRDLDAVCTQAAVQASAKHPDNTQAAVAFAALRVLLACNSQPSIQDTHNYELAQKSVGQHPSPEKKQSPREK